MSLTLHIKNMVCDRCNATVLNELENLGYKVESVRLGQVVLSEESVIDKGNVEDILEKHGLELIKESSEVVIEKIKIALLGKIEEQNNANLSTFLSKTFDKSYSALSKFFSKTEGITIEKYEISLKIEKVKELIQLGQLNFSEIAYSLNYNNSAHLAKQFKGVTGMSMTQYRKLKGEDRKALDKIV